LQLKLCDPCLSALCPDMALCKHCIYSLCAVLSDRLLHCMLSLRFVNGLIETLFVCIRCERTLRVHPYTGRLSFSLSGKSTISATLSDKRNCLVAVLLTGPNPPSFSKSWSRYWDFVGPFEACPSEPGSLMVLGRIGSRMLI